MKGVTRGQHLACFVDQSGSPGLSITSLCTGVHAHVISMSCLPQFRRLDVFGKLTVPHMAGLPLVGGSPAFVRHTWYPAVAATPHCPPGVLSACSRMITAFPTAVA